MKKRMYLVVPVLMAALSFQGCGWNDDDDDAPRANVDRATVVVPVPESETGTAISNQTFAFPATAAKAFDLAAADVGTEDILLSFTYFVNDQATGAAKGGFDIAAGDKHSTGDVMIGSCSFKVTNRGVEPGTELLPTGKWVRIEPCEVEVEAEVAGPSGEAQEMKAAKVKFKVFQSVECDQATGKAIKNADGSLKVKTTLTSDELPLPVVVEGPSLAVLGQKIKIVVVVDAQGKVDPTRTVATVNGKGATVEIDDGKIVVTLPGGQTTGATGGSGGGSDSN